MVHSEKLGERTKIKDQKSKKLKDFPSGPVVKNLPSKAGDVGLIPGWGTKIPQAIGQLSLCTAILYATAREKPICCNEKSMCCN